jgi:hypothetical protein
MNAKSQIEKHIAQQSSVMLDWQSARPQIKERILSLEKRIKRIEALEALLHKALRRIEKLEARPTGLRSLF